MQLWGPNAKLLSCYVSHVDPGSCRICLIHFVAGWCKMPQNQPLISLCLVLLEYISSYMYMSFTLVLLQFGCCLILFTSVSRVIGWEN